VVAGEALSAAHVADALSRAPEASLLVDTLGVVTAANDPAAHLVDLNSASDILGTEIYRFTPEELARHRLQDVADGTVEAALARVDITTATGQHKTSTAWWRRLDSDQGIRTLVVLTPLQLTPNTRPVAPVQASLALITMDHDWRIVDLSRDAEQLIGAGDLVGHGLLGFIHPLDLNEAIAGLGVLSDEVHTVTVQARFRGSTGWEECHVTFARLCPHQPPRLVCLLSPMSTALGAEQQLGAMLEQRETGQLLAYAGRALDQLATTHQLSAQEIEIIARSVRGEAPRKIAQTMYLGEGTVRNILSALYRKFGVHSQLELVAVVLQAG
jgi:DNA-binding CsgD family transcriptional regulator